MSRTDRIKIPTAQFEHLLDVQHRIEFGCGSSSLETSSCYTDGVGAHSKAIHETHVPTNMKIMDKPEEQTFYSLLIVQLSACTRPRKQRDSSLDC